MLIWSGRYVRNYQGNMLTSVMRMGILNLYPNTYTSLKQQLPYIWVSLCSDLNRNVLVFCVVKWTVCRTKLIGKLCILYRISYVWLRSSLRSLCHLSAFVAESCHSFPQSARRNANLILSDKS
jgi:hypothetical protein